MQDLPERVSALTDRLMAHVDARMPGQLEGFYLVGSVAQGDYREGQSDVDFVAVLAGPHEAGILAAIHADLAETFPGLHCDGIYVRSDELSAPPAGEGLRVHEGRVSLSTGERHPVTWVLLADDGLALRGRRPGAGWIAADRGAAVQYSRENLASYWRHWLEAHRSGPERPAGLADAAVSWGALGVARVHATVAERRVLSKTAAGTYALDVFPDHQRIIAEGLRLRINPEKPPRYSSHEERRRDLVAFMEEVIHTGGSAEA